MENILDQRAVKETGERGMSPKPRNWPKGYFLLNLTLCVRREGKGKPGYQILKKSLFGFIYLDKKLFVKTFSLFITGGYQFAVIKHLEHSCVGEGLLRA